MAFWVTASVPIKPLGNFNAFKKRANALNVVKGHNLIENEVFERMASVYAVSPNPADYGFLSALAVREGVPNSNGDATSKEELFRFRPARRCRTFETFIQSPLQINHFASNPKLARGFIIDAVYNTWDEPFEFVETVIAIDKTKDPVLADALLTGKIKTFSMGSIVESLQCSLSFCKKVAHKESELCEHLKTQKMQMVNGELCFEWNIGVDYEELSVVENPAEKMAMTRKILGQAPHLRSVLNYLSPERRAGFAIAASSKEITWGEIMGLDEKDRRVIDEFVDIYKNRLPIPVLTMLKKSKEVIG